MSNSGNIGRPWTPHEDALLTEAVLKYGENTEKWKTIALFVPGRTNKACRKRWLHSLSPSVKKSAWTPEEDQSLLSLFEKHPNKWSQIARGIPGRTDDACSKRYREALDPNLRKEEWTEDEDRRLLDSLTRHGGSSKPKWGLIGQELRRSGLGCRNRWRLLERKRLASIRQASCSMSTDLPSAPQGLINTPSLSTGVNAISFWDTSWDTSELDIPDLWQNQSVPGLNLPLDKIPVYEQPESSVLMEQHSEYFRPTAIQPNLLTQQATDSHNFPSISFNATYPNQPILQHIDQSIMDNLPPGLSFTASMDSNCPLQPQTNISQLPEVSNVNENLQSPSESSYVNRDVECADLTTVRLGVEAADSPVGPDSEVNNTIYETDELYRPITPPLGLSLLPSHVESTSSQELPQESENHVLLPKKRRRTIANDPSLQSVHIMSITVGDQKAPPKLSSTLPVSNDASILPYACGHKACWPGGHSESNSCFATSGELSAHFKDIHIGDNSACEVPPFRCGLKGCGKSWKSINGLQYHLQISKVHYLQILGVTKQKRPPREHSTNEDTTSSRSLGLNKPKKKLHRCTFSDCGKEYKQLSGLRYHILHGHPNITPAQLDALPPTIATKLDVIDY